jgi:hypothetical protein
MTNFMVRGSKIGTQLVQRLGESEVSFIDIPDSRVRAVGKALVDIANAKDALENYFTGVAHD